MSKLGITTGSSPNDGTGDTLLQGAVKINSNFDEVYTFLGDGSALTTIANDKLSGSITNNKLVNSSVSFGGISVDLGSSDATPAFDLSDATNYPTSSLSGTITNAQLAGSIADGKLSSTFLKNVVDDTTPQLGGNLNLNSKNITGTGNIPAANLTGTLPSIDGSSLTGIVTSIVAGSNITLTGGPTGIVTINSSGGGSLQNRTVVSGATTSIENNGIGNTDITGFKSYALMKVGLSTSGWIRLYTDSTSRTNDSSRSVGIDPTPGSGVIAEVVTTGISTTQVITPFVMGGNLNNPSDATIYVAIKNLSGSTQSITANLTILQLEA
jgi:hypothetical protein